MAFDGVIFDLDGTLWDSSRAVCKAWHTAAEEYRPGLGERITPEAIRRNMGRLLPDIFKDLFPELGAVDRRSLLDLCGRNELEVVAQEGGILFPELEQTLSALQARYPLFIVSNCQNGYISAFYQAHGLKKYFTEVEFAGRTGLSKGENISVLVKRNHLQNPVYIGDTQGDYDAAKLAGVPFIHAAYGFGTVDDPDVTVLDAFAKLPDMLLRMNPQRFLKG